MSRALVFFFSWRLWHIFKISNTNRDQPERAVGVNHIREVWTKHTKQTNKQIQDMICGQTKEWANNASYRYIRIYRSHDEWRKCRRDCRLNILVRFVNKSNSQWYLKQQFINAVINAHGNRIKRNSMLFSQRSVTCIGGIFEYTCSVVFLSIVSFVGRRIVFCLRYIWIMNTSCDAQWVTILGFFKRHTRKEAMGVIVRWWME